MHRPDLVLWPHERPPSEAGRGRGGADRQGARAPRGDLPRLGALRARSPASSTSPLRAVQAPLRACSGRVRAGGPRRDRRALDAARVTLPATLHRHARGRPRRVGENRPSRRLACARGCRQSSSGGTPDVLSAINRVVLIGRLTRDPELRALPSGTGVCGLRIACNSSRARRRRASTASGPTTSTSPSSARRRRTSSSYTRKGSRVAIDGRLEWREWETDRAAATPGREHRRRHGPVPRLAGRARRRRSWSDAGDLRRRGARERRRPRTSPASRRPRGARAGLPR